MAAFTMVEIALCLAIIGFALVAIIGVLPAGLNVQKENREDTVINQDATLFMNAIRNGDQGYDELTNFVERITVRRSFYAGPNFNNAQALDPIIGEPTFDFSPNVLLTNGANIIGLLSTPKYQAVQNGFISNHVVAYFRAFSGNASEKVDRSNPARELSFAYRLISEVTPPLYTDYYQVNTNDVGYAFARNMHDVRLVFSWPLISPPDRNRSLTVLTNVGSSRLVFRSQVSGYMGGVPIPNVAGTNNFFFFLNPEGNGRLTL
jgi:type II secretory pathway pseudopilin PulG